MAQRDRNDRGPITGPAGIPASAGGLNQRGTVLAAGVFLFLVASLAYAGPSWLQLAYHGLVDSAFLAMWLAGAAGIGATLLGQIQINRDDTEAALVRPVSAIGLGLGTLSLIVLGLGLAGWLNRVTSFATLLVGVTLGLVGMKRRGRLPPGGVREWLRAPAGWAWLWLALVPLLAIAFVGSLLPPGLLWHPDEPHGYDVIEYHLQIPREWYEAGRVVPLRHNVFSFFPFSVETHFLMAMHLRGGPWAGMYLAQFMHVAHVALTVVTLYGFAKWLAPRGGGAVIAAVVAGSVPWLALLAPMAYNEGGLLLYGMLAIGHTLCAASPPTISLRRLGLAGAFAGFACGTKLTGVPMLLLGVPAALVIDVLLSRRLPLKGVLVGSAVFIAAGVLTFSPWLVRTGVWADGNPVFPEAASVLGRAHFSEMQAERWRRAHAPPPQQASAAARVATFGRQVWGDWRFGFVLLPLAAASVVLTWRTKPAPWLLLSLLAMLSTFWLALTHLQGRFFVLAVPVAGLLVARIDWGGRRAVAGAAVGLAVSLLGWFLVHRQFAARMYGRQPWVAVVGLAGEDLIGMHPPEVAALPPGATLTLVGDARAFWYPRPMSLLRYRTVFDVDSPAGDNVLDAWRGRSTLAPDEWQLVDPRELVRFSKTYWGIPEPPPEVKARTEPYVVSPLGR